MHQLFNFESRPDAIKDGHQGKSRRLLVGAIAVLAALFVHGVAFLWLPQFYLPQKSRPRVTVHFTKRVPPTNTPAKQLVTLAPSQATEAPKNAKYFAAVNQKTNHETKAKPIAASSQANAPMPQGIDLGHYLAKRAPKDPLGLANNIPGSSHDDGLPVSDHLADTAEGDETRLNAWQWQHAPFFDRLKKTIARTWAPDAQIARFDPQGSLLGQRDRETVVRVTIDTLGNLAQVEVTSSSGVAYLDAEAQRAFTKAAPFPHPPKELFAMHDHFTFTFAFHLRVEHGLQFNVSW